MRTVKLILTKKEAGQLIKMEDRFFSGLTEDDKHVLYKVTTLANHAIAQNQPLTFDVGQ